MKWLKINFQASKLVTVRSVIISTWTNRRFFLKECRMFRQVRMVQNGPYLSQQSVRPYCLATHTRRISRRCGPGVGNRGCLVSKYTIREKQGLANYFTSKVKIFELKTLRKGFGYFRPKETIHVTLPFLNLGPFFGFFLNHGHSFPHILYW